MRSGLDHGRPRTLGSTSPAAGGGSAGTAAPPARRPRRALGAGPQPQPRRADGGLALAQRLERVEGPGCEVPPRPRSRPDPLPRAAQSAAAGPDQRPPLADAARAATPRPAAARLGTPGRGLASPQRHWPGPQLPRRNGAFPTRLPPEPLRRWVCVSPPSLGAGYQGWSSSRRERAAARLPRRQVVSSVSKRLTGPAGGSTVKASSAYHRACEVLPRRAVGTGRCWLEVEPWRRSDSSAWATWATR